MTALFVSLVVAFGLAAAAARALARSTSRFWPRDEPNARSLHAMPTPRTGGLAILLGLGAGAAVCRLLGGDPVIPSDGRTFWILGGIVLIAATSFLDDLFDLPQAFRLVLQALAAAAVVWGAGLAITTLSIPGIGAMHLGGLASVIGFLGLLWMTNLYNFMDGLDGLAGGMTVIGGAFFGLALLHGGDAGARIAFVLAAAAAGFLLLNFPPARLFMGDSGAVTIGFLFGVLILRAAASGSVDVVVSLIIFAPFVADATVTLFLRLLRGERIWEAHRSHFYQRLVLAGWSHRRTVPMEYGLMFVCGGAALLYSRLDEGGRGALLAALAVLFAVAIAGVRRAEAGRRSATR